MFTFQEPGRSLGPEYKTGRVEIPKGIGGRSDLFSVYVSQLAFPAYFGWNWDAFEECLNDLSWIDEGQVVIHHVDLPLADPGDRRTYLKILLAALERWSTPDGPRLAVVFPVGCEEAIDEALASEARG